MKRRYETVGSLKAFFIISSLICAVGAIVKFNEAKGNAIEIIYAVIFIGISIAWFCLGVFLKTLLVKSPRAIVKMILITALFLSIWPVSNLLRGIPDPHWNNWKAIIFGLGIILYLLQKIKHLSSERQSEEEN